MRLFSDWRLGLSHLEVVSTFPNNAKPIQSSQNAVQTDQQQDIAEPVKNHIQDIDILIKIMKILFRSDAQASKSYSSRVRQLQNQITAKQKTEYIIVDLKQRMLHALSHSLWSTCVKKMAWFDCTIGEPGYSELPIFMERRA